MSKRSKRRIERLHVKTAIVTLCAACLWCAPFASGQTATSASDWKQVEAAMGRPGQAQPGDVIRFGMPRKDLHVVLDGVEIKAGLALGSWAAFKRNGSEAMVMGDLALTEDEVEPVMMKLQQATLKMPGPDAQNLMLGKWSTQVQYAPSTEMPNGGTGEGTEIWRPGPGGLSVIEEYHEKNEKGAYDGLGVAWWDSKAQGQRFVWCDSSNPDGCYVSKEVAKWNGTNLVWKEEQENAGKRRVYSEVFQDIAPTSFTQVLGEGDSGEALKTTVTIRARKVMDSRMSGISASGETELRSAMAARHKAMLAGDASTVERLTADEYVQTDISGYVQDESAWLNEYFRPLATLMKAGKFRWDTYEENDVHIHMYGDTAVVVGSMNLKGTGAKPSGHTWVESPENTFAGTLRFTRVWVNRGGSWQVVALQNALMQQSKDDRK